MYNIDKNSTANLVQSYFQGTGISLFHLRDHENQGEILDCHGFIDTVYNVRKLAPLPAEYTQPRKVYCSSEELFALLCRFNYEDLFEYPQLNLAKTEDQQWLQQFANFADSAKSWAQYHIHEKFIQPPNIKDPNSLLPLLCDRVNTLHMQVNTMNLNIKAIRGLNPGKTSVNICDCSVYALTKETQFLSIFRTIFQCLEDYIWSNACWLLMDNSLKEVV